MNHDDDALAREVERALAVHPSPEFQARVRVHLAGQPAPGRWSWGWLPVVAASAAVVLLAAIVMMSRPAKEPAIVATKGTDTQLSSPTAVVPAPPRVAAAAAPREHPIARVIRNVEPSPGAPARDEILIPAGEAAALRRLMRGLPSGRVDPSTLAEESTPLQVATVRLPPVIQLAPLAPLSSITLDPLGRLPLRDEKGVRQ